MPAGGKTYIFVMVGDDDWHIKKGTAILAERTGSNAYDNLSFVPIFFTEGEHPLTFTYKDTS
ncbi:MAG: hypothetical protein Q4B28_01115 [bacterium]|nr:hypothetical protein [bacterium]